MITLTIKSLFITLTFILISCGVEGDVNVNADMEPTDKEASEETEETEDGLKIEEEEEIVECAEGKLCPGMTREQVLELIGDPIEIVDYGFAHAHYWHYNNDDQGVDYCTTKHLDCKLRFNRDGTLQEQNYFSLDYLEILKWND